MALGFFVAGYLMRKWLMAPKSGKELTLWIVAGALAVSATVIFNGDVTNLNSVVFGHSILLSYIGAIGGSLMVFELSQLLVRKVSFPTWAKTLINDTAYGAVLLIMLQWVFGDIYIDIFGDVHPQLNEVISSIWCTSFIMAFYLLLVPLCRRYFPYLLGR
ncbi:MAG: hypothetical protein LUC85_06550 [Bacteroidales bacterium]|nr:hypothetical protein [Bacteroidales bacterium]MCD8394479.1 hypothetical protein [Bacteroidales bacterium]